MRERERERERERKREGEREREFIFDLKNLVVTLANACHEMRVTALTLNTFVQTHTRMPPIRIYLGILTQHNQHNTDKFVIAQVMKKYDKKRMFYHSCHM